MAQDIVDTWLLESLQQGLQKGIQQGIQKNQTQTIQRLLQRGRFSLEEIASLVNTDLARVREVAETINNDLTVRRCPRQAGDRNGSRHRRYVASRVSPTGT